MKIYQRTKCFLIVALLLLSSWITVGHAGFLVDATICGKPARLGLDTGSGFSAIYRPWVQRMGFPLPPTDHQTNQGYYRWDGCRIKAFGFTHKAQIHLLELPDSLSPPEDGLLGWPEVSHQMLALNALDDSVDILKTLPKDLSGWTRLKIRPIEFGILALEVSETNGVKGIIIVDTGSGTGLGLAPEHWREWKASHSGQPITFTSAYSPGAGRVLMREQAWSEAFSLGPVNLTDVVVEEADPLSLRAAGGRHAATLGMQALARLDFIVDGRHGFAYLRPKTTAPPPSNHNRFGVVFEYRDAQSDGIVVRVGEGGPACEGGMRNGDILQCIGDLDVTRQHEPRGLAPPVCLPLDAPAGLETFPFTVKRGSETLVFTIVTRDILPPGPSAK